MKESEEDPLDPIKILWVQWRDLVTLGRGEDHVKLRCVHRSLVHVSLTSTGNKRWELSAIYASPNLSIKKHLWDTLNELKIDELWLLVGDFNRVMKKDVRSSRRDIK